MSGCSSDPATLGASKPATEEAKSSSEISESVLLRDDQKFDTCELQEGLPAQPMMGIIIESTMTQESPKNSAAEIPVTSNGEVDDSHEHGFNRDLKRSLPAGLGLSETQITTHGFDSTKEGVIEAGAFQDSWSLLRLRSIESVMPSNHLILCCPLLLLPSVFPSISLPVLYPWDSSGACERVLGSFSHERLFQTPTLPDPMDWLFCPWDSPGLCKEETLRTCSALCPGRAFPKVREREGLWTRVGLPRWALVVKNLPGNAGDTGNAGSIPGSRRFSGGGHGNPLQYPRLEKLMDRGAWQATLHGVTDLDTTEATEHARWTRAGDRRLPRRVESLALRLPGDRPAGTVKGSTESEMEGGRDFPGSSAGSQHSHGLPALERQPGSGGGRTEVCVYAGKGV
ncbi:uncharacterized protein LOC129535523 isoform X3 [Moschus berezovskii]|uniref:uncharacterized protein LOC129535523 isoform X3 n=1 Tax=Moschus berezovskii TaxID=68408 RepID=UPI0024451D35|nr:uncharacterized protein LOC129535523 isoform X3 [Moschus berezovskii]